MDTPHSFYVYFGCERHICGVVVVGEENLPISS